MPEAVSKERHHGIFTPTSGSAISDSYLSCTNKGWYRSCCENKSKVLLKGDLVPVDVAHNARLRVGRQNLSRTQCRFYGLSITDLCRSAPSDFRPADKVVKVPEMAESISEGTLKQWSKRSCTVIRLRYRHTFAEL